MAEDVTDLLAKWAGGDRASLDAVMPMVYAELRRIAGAYLRQEREGHTLQPTALVHEAWVRLIHQRHPSFPHRKHFYALAAQVMRHILVDHARAARAEKRGGAGERTDLRESMMVAENTTVDLLALDEALTALSRLDARQAEVIEMRYFGGLTLDDVADLLGVSAATISRDQRAAEAWLHHVLAAGGPVR